MDLISKLSSRGCARRELSDQVHSIGRAAAGFALDDDTTATSSDLSLCHSVAVAGEYHCVDCASIARLGSLLIDLDATCNSAPSAEPGPLLASHCMLSSFSSSSLATI